MTDLGREKEFGPPDPVASVDAIDEDEPLDMDDTEKGFEESASPADSASRSLSEKQPCAKETRPHLEQSKSYATTASAVTRAESNMQQPRKAWYKNYNPLRWGRTPPVPETRQICREYNAPFLSLLYFQWMSPLMSVSASRSSKRYTLTCLGRIQAAARAERYLDGQSKPLRRCDN